jgi:hypothetical protein
MELGGAVAAGLLGMGVAETMALKPIKPIHVADRPTVIDGPPTQVEPAPPPHPRRRPRPHPVEPVEDPDLAQYASAGPQDVRAAPVGGPAQEAGPVRPADACAQAPSPADRMVCATPGLAAAEATEQGLYHMQLADSDEPAAARYEQRRWREARDRVAATEGPQGLAALYDERIRELTGPPR